MKTLGKIDQRIRPMDYPITKADVRHAPFWQRLCFAVRRREK